ncbi:MAG: mandelate racemase/muconate lactonizing enzyme family protein [Phycisphaerae bacterium]|nr:mandelate racemase/muconate lactonizing enzyme family protein [Phycisphaerae bacterium]
MDRRHFLELGVGIGGTLVSGCGLKANRAQRIREADEATRTALDQIARDPVLRLVDLESPVLIDSIQLVSDGRDTFVHVRSKDGAQGLSVTNGRAYLHEILRKCVIPYFKGKDARDLEAHLFEVYRHGSNYKLQGLALWCPVAWVEMAILDMLGRINGRSMGQLLGDPVRDAVPFYVASSRRDTTPEQEVVHLQSLIDETGAKAVKYRVGGRMSRNEDSLPGRTEGLIPLSRKALGDQIAIHADANSSYDASHAIEVGRMLEAIGAEHFEEPCPFDDLEATRQVTQALTIPIAGGEQEFSEARFRDMIARRCVDITQPDLHYYGGMIRSTRVARMSAALGMPTTVHISGGFGFVYMLHFASFTPDIGPYQEYKTGVERYGKWFDPALEIRDGALTVPQGPGVGIKDIDAVLKGAKPV